MDDRWSVVVVSVNNRDSANLDKTQDQLHAMEDKCTGLYSALHVERQLSHDMSRMRGWSHEILHIIEACWSQELSARFPAGQIVEKLRDQAAAIERPFDVFNTSFPTQVSQSHPFYILLKPTEAIQKLDKSMNLALHAHG
jgi:hypothetical protein